jgi:hypothetical protein
MDTRAPRARAALLGVCARWGAACVRLARHPDAGRLKPVLQHVLARSCARGVVVIRLVLYTSMDIPQPAGRVLSVDTYSLRCMPLGELVYKLGNVHFH